MRTAAPRQQATREDAAQGVVIRTRRIGRKIDVRRAQAFARIDASNHFVFEGCASIAEYGLRFGYSSQEARQYAAAGRVIELCPLAEQLVLDGSMSYVTLAIIEPLFTDPELRLPDDHGNPMTDERILEWAALRPDRDLRATVRERREETRIGQKPNRRTLYLSKQGADDLDRTQVLCCRKEGRMVTGSEAAERAFREFVKNHDLMEQTPRKRRTPVTSLRTDGGKNPRYVAAEVRRALMKRYGDVCCIDKCENRIWLENAHQTPHSHGAGNECDDQDRLCVMHHRMKDSGELVWVHDPNEPAGGYYKTPEGRVVRLKPLPPRPPGGFPDAVRERAPPLIASVSSSAISRGRRAWGAPDDTIRSWPPGSCRRSRSSAACHAPRRDRAGAGPRPCP